MEKLALQFVQRLPGGMSYSDAQLLCFWLFLTAGRFAVAVHIASRRWLIFFVRPLIIRL